MLYRLVLMAGAINLFIPLTTFAEIVFDVKDTGRKTRTVRLSTVSEALRETISETNGGAWKFFSVEPQVDGSLIFNMPSIYYDGKWQGVSEFNDKHLFCRMMKMSGRADIQTGGMFSGERLYLYLEDHEGEVRIGIVQPVKVNSFRVIEKIRCLGPVMREKTDGSEYSFDG